MKTSTIALSLILATGIASRASAQNTADNVLQCNGSTDYIASNALIGVTNDFTMEAWVYPVEAHEIDQENATGMDGITGQHYAIYPLHGTACWGPDNAGAGFSVGMNGVSVYEHAADYMPATLVYKANLRGWTHVAVVYRDRIPSLYINGVLVKTGVRGSQRFVHPSAGREATTKYVFGGIGGGPLGHFAGLIDNVRIWGNARSADEIRSAMASASITGKDLLVSFDMNRAGAGNGLTVSNLATSQIALGTTVGTSATPAFIPRTRAAPQMQRPSAGQDMKAGAGPGLE